MRRLVLAAAAVALMGCATQSWSDDAVTRFVERAEIDRNLNDLRCTTITRDGEALKLSRKDRPEDLRRIDAALARF